MHDLHIHTAYSSDGQHTPAEIFAMAARRGVTALAFTDHMEIAAVSQGLTEARQWQLEYFPGVEFSTLYQEREYHLLAYGFDHHDRTLVDFLAHYCARIWEQAADTVAKLHGLGFEISTDDIAGWGRSIPSGVTFLDALKKRNPHDSRLEPYISGSKAKAPYLNFYKDFLLTDLGQALRSRLPDLIETMDLFKQKAVLILAHPQRIEEALLSSWKGQGLAGIEVYSTYHDQDVENRLLRIAESLGLMVSAGSDFHGNKVKPGIAVGDVRGPASPSLLQALRKSSI